MSHAPFSVRADNGNAFFASLGFFSASLTCLPLNKKLNIMGPLKVKGSFFRLPTRAFLARTRQREYRTALSCIKDTRFVICLRSSRAVVGFAGFVIVVVVVLEAAGP